MFKTVTITLTGQNLFARDFIVLVIETSLKASIKTQRENTMCTYFVCLCTTSSTR